MPWKRMRVRDGDVPYVTTEWKEAIRRRTKAIRRFHKTKAPEDWELHRKLRNEARRLRRKAILRLLEYEVRRSQKQATQALQNFHAFSWI